MEDRVQRRTRLTPEQKWQVFVEASPQGGLRRRSVPAVGHYPVAAPGDPRTRQAGSHRGPRQGPRAAPARSGTGSPGARPGADVERVEGARHREHAAAGKSGWGLIGAIAGRRLPAPVKLQIIAAITAANAGGMSVERACEVLMLGPRRYRRWVRGRDPVTLRVRHVQDASPVARRRPHSLLPVERKRIRAAAKRPELAALRHRKLTHNLSRTGELFCSESSVLRELRAAGLGPVYQRRSR